MQRPSLHACCSQHTHALYVLMCIAKASQPASQLHGRQPATAAATAPAGAQLPPRTPWQLPGLQLMSSEAADAAAAPFPFTAIAVLWATTFATTIANWSVMPFVPFMVYDMGLVSDYREPGLYAGIIIAANRLGAMLTSYPCGKWSDVHGRKPPLQLSLAGLGLTTLVFGFSGSLEMAVAVRFAGGLAAGGRDLTQVMVTEICQQCPQHAARAMSGNAAMWGLAVIVGPALGGLLARPAINCKCARSFRHSPPPRAHVMCPAHVSSDSDQ